MFFESNFFWLLMGFVLVLVAAAFKSFAEDRGWTLTWWKGILALIWYGLVCLTIYAGATLAGENERSAGVKLILFGLFICLILGVGLWRSIAPKSRAANKE